MPEPGEFAAKIRAGVDAWRHDPLQDVRTVATTTPMHRNLLDELGARMLYDLRVALDNAILYGSEPWKWPDTWRGWPRFDPVPWFTRWQHRVRRARRFPAFASQRASDVWWAARHGIDDRDDGWA